MQRSPFYDESDDATRQIAREKITIAVVDPADVLAVPHVDMRWRVMLKYIVITIP